MINKPIWPKARAQEIRRLLFALGQKPSLRFTFAPSTETDFIQYFPADYASDFTALKSEGFEYVPPSFGLAKCDVAIISTHGSYDLSSEFWNMRQVAEKILIAVWLWDNHVMQDTNLQTVMAADLIFASHRYAMDYLINPASALALHVPSCSAQWTKHQASQLFESQVGSARSNKLLVNYVDYEFSWRSSLLRQMKIEAPEAEVILMPPNDRSRYFKMSGTERFREWLDYKASLILPLTQDLSTRVFDALLAGQVIVVPKMIRDFDNVILPDLQQQLGILRLPDLNIATIRRFALQAIELFDQGGIEGARKRHAFVLENHMVVNRLKTILTFIKQTSTSGITTEFYGDQKTRYGIHFKEKRQ